MPRKSLKYSVSWNGSCLGLFLHVCLSPVERVALLKQVYKHMVKIRLARGGAKKRPFYHIVATDGRNKRDGRYIERLGFFNPVARGQEERLRVNIERVDHWLSEGAQLTDRVNTLMKDARKAAETAVAA